MIARDSLSITNRIFLFPGDELFTCIKYWVFHPSVHL